MRSSPEFDKQLVREARAGSRAALGRLLTLCAPIVEVYLRRHVGPGLRRHTSLSDIQQVAMLRGVDALRRLPETASLSDAKALFLRHARWAIGHSVRQAQAFAGESDGRVDRRAAALAAPVSSEGVVTRGDELRKLESEVRRLPRELADVVRLRLRGCTFREIALELGAAEDTVRKRLLRAAVLLRERGAPRSGD